MFAIQKNKIVIIPILILILGIIIRLLYVSYFGFENYTHDLQSHVEYIQFVSQHLSLPEVNKGPLEYPQQPLYYIVMGVAYRLLALFLNSKDAILRILVCFSALFSIGTLLFGYLISKKIIDSVWVQSFIVGILAFTPAFVYQSGMVGNDPLLAFFSAASFFFLACFIKDEKLKNIIFAIAFASLAALAKISGGILLIIILLAILFKNYKKTFRKTAIILVSAVFIIGVLCLLLAFWRAYIPSTGKFDFMESASYGGQKTNPENLSYFYTFNFPKLLKEGQSYVFGDKNIARTFPTFLYGSFIFGEYSYNNITDIYPFIKILMQLIIFFGMLLPLGIIFNIFFVKKWDQIDYIFITAFIINLALIISFVFRYPAVCNSDFRYFAGFFAHINFVRHRYFPAE